MSEDDSYVGEPSGDDPPAEHKGHYECPKCGHVEHAPGTCPECGAVMEQAD